MGGFNSFEEHESGGRSPGKIDTSLRAKLEGAQWGEFRIGDLFNIHPTRAYKLTSGELFSPDGRMPVVTNSSSNNGITGFSTLPPTEVGPMLTFSDTTTGDCIFVQPRPFIGYPHIQGMYPVEQPDEWDCASLLFVAALMRKAARGRFSYGNKFTRDAARDMQIMLPCKGDKSIDFQAMRYIIAELEARHVAELEAYLSSAGLSDCTLDEVDYGALSALASADWASFNLKQLFGPSTRGKRLKSADRTVGDLPFVTAGESDTGVSAFIGNDVQVFPAGSFTIDMFGSAKFRNYSYGGDDHVAVVHTENLTRNAAIFVTGAAHKAAHTGAFDYGRNFYAKDADVLDISLPVKDGKPDWELMDAVIGATHKLVVQGVSEFAAHEIEASRKITGLGVE